MERLDFSSKAASYEETGLIQKMTGRILLDLADISGSDRVLDLGCGPGGTTARIAQMTSGRVVGVDVSEGMIEKAVATYSGPPHLSFLARVRLPLKRRSSHERYWTPPRMFCPAS